MTEIHAPTSHIENGPSRLSASSLSMGRGGEAVGAQLIPLDSEEDSELKFPFDEYCQRGSLWVIPGHEMIEFKRPENPVYVFECWKYDGTSELHVSPVTESKEIKEDEIEAWAKAVPPTNEGLKPVAGYKIIHLDHPPGDTFPLRGKIYQALIETFKLPAIEFHAGSSWQGACGVFREDDGGFLLINRRPNIRNSISTIFRYDPLTNITCGYIITDEDYNVISTLRFSFLSSQFLACSHPILLPIVVIEQALLERIWSAGTVEQSLRQIEEMTGFTSFAAKKTDGLGLQNIVRKLGEVHAYYSATEASFLVFKQAIAMFKQELENMNSEISPDIVKGNFERYMQRLRDRIRYLESTLEHAILHGNIKTRLQAQQQVLFNLIAQADTKINIGLAEDSREIAAASKQDSSAMKIIAMLTTLFLPGTFIATFFGMPLFNWQEASIYHVTNRHFWVYWAVTGPLTLATMILVISWAYWHRSHLRAEVGRARKGTDGKRIISNDSNNEEEVLDLDNGVSGAEVMERGGQKKRFYEAVLRRRLLGKGATKKQDDPESLKDNDKAEVSNVI